MQISELRKTIEERKQTVILRSVLILLVFVLLFFAKAVYQGIELRMLSLGTSGALLIAGLALSHLHHWRAASWFVVAGMWVAVTVSMVTSGGFESTAFAWYLIIFLLAGLVGTKGFCVFWAAVSLATLGVFLLPAGVAFFAQFKVPTTSNFHNHLMALMQLAAALALTLAYLRTNEKYDSALMAHVRALDKEVEQRRQAELAAVESNKVKTQFLKNMSHELRTPLNAIIGFSSRLLAKDESLSERSQEALKSIKRNGEALSLLVDDVIDMATLDQHAMKHAAEMVDLRDLVAQHTEEARPYAHVNGIQLTLDEIKPVQVHCHGDLMGQAIKSVVFFCISQMREGQIHISTALTERGGEVGASVLIKDSSEGMTAEQAGVLFEGHYEFIIHNDKALPISAVSLVKLKNQLNQSGAMLSLRHTDASGNEFEIWVPLASESLLSDRSSATD